MDLVAQDLLWGVAREQRGFFTMREALGSGVSRKGVEHLVASHEVERAGHGVLRFPRFPATAQDRFQLAVLWTGTEAACLSHETALEAHGVTDVMADRIQLTVPANWPADYERAARDAQFADSLVEAIAQLNSWISDIETSPETKRTPR
jgi:predicted transcriptional regulator of viral defense system